MMKKTVTVRADFPGGNIVVKRIDNFVLTLEPELRDTAGDWFYWYFEATFPIEGEYTFHLINGTRGPAVSRDAGKSWCWLGADSLLERNGFRFLAARGETVRFAVCIPYLQRDFDLWYRRHRSNPFLYKSELTRSIGGRAVERLEVKEGAPRKTVLLTTRHHSGETSGSFVLEGILEAALADTPTGRALRRQTRILAIPFADKDGVEAGDQGKNRKPHDHDFDYSGTCSRYPSCSALREILNECQPCVVLDLHSPWLYGGNNEALYIVGPRSERMQPIAVRWSEWLENHASAAVPFSAADYLPFGTDWNTAELYGEHRTLPQLAAEYPFVHAAFTMEIPFANLREVTFSPERQRRFGESLAQLLAEELERPEKRKTE